MSRRAALAGIVVASSLAACAAPRLAPGEPREVRALPLPPFQENEECFAMDRGEELRWRFAADGPLDFRVQFRDGKAVVVPVVRERVAADSGRFVALAAQDYCAVWEAGRIGVLLDYALELARPQR
ncbi:MAG: hypothetical protein OEX23_16670 [Betaproteobacteria bacterium]|nr:hypothetical protein [Betaproteobacteria bacterium]